jgi:hypothetical protein
VTGKRIVQADSLFETVLGLLLLVGVVTGWLDGGDFATPLGTALLVALGVALIGIGVFLWRVARHEIPGTLLHSLALGNLGTAAFALFWWLAFAGFSGAGSAVTLATVVALTLLGVAQLRQARGSSTTNVAPAPGAD